MMMMMMSQSRSSSSSSPDREKRNPEEAAANICKIADQVEQEVGWSWSDHDYHDDDDYYTDDYDGTISGQNEGEVGPLLKLVTMAQLQGLTCMILGLIPVLAEEVRGAPYSSCWSSQVVLMEVKELPPSLDFIERYDRLMVRNWNAGELSSCSALPKSVKALSSYRPPHVQVCRFRIRSIRKKKVHCLN